MSYFFLALIITGMIIAGAEHRVWEWRSRHTFIQTKPFTLEEGLKKTREYFEYSISLFRESEAREQFIEMYMISPEGAILTTMVVLALTMALVFVLGLYWGLKAGYNGKRSDRILTTLAPVFSAIPGWFWGVFLIWVLWWRTGLSTIDYMTYIARARLNDELGFGTYLNAMLIPVLTLTFANVVIYAFNVRTLVRKEMHEEHFFADVLKGLPDRKIMKKLLRTVLPSFLTFTSYNFLNLLVNGMAVEKLFNVNGIGYVFATSAGRQYDYVWSYLRRIHVVAFSFVFRPELLFFVALVMAFLYFVNSSVMEVLYSKLDPRVRRDV
ncbi:ABC transporter permease [Thermococcus sp. MAR1]|uniref:ABC transporter permease subunit n=1 Tax=Thermococcus sp. MAR1 TaxID=1638263 RepID=UPI001F113DC1|nr:ABC transporter permease [Thermococcus sp. MAR1]